MKKILLLIGFGVTFGLSAQNRLESTGNVGVGTLTPSDKLTIESENSYANLRLTRKGSNPADFRIWSGYGQLEFRNSLNEVKLSLDDNGNLGLGTIMPSDKLTIENENSYANLRLTRKGSNPADFRIWSGYGQLEFRNSSNEVKLLIRDNGNVGIGTLSPGSWKLAVNGNIRAKEIKVETGWSDFVFYKDYELPTLAEVENHIKEKGHLKDIPSAVEVEKNGIFLGKMNAKLLQKIEELTLYTIQQHKEIEKLKLQNKKFLELQSRLEKLEAKK
ncbi:hypothetical protein [Aquimarina sp. RZ0]|uniref:hypothetical protein n=1 Tax=Aquimarina sp. RZ0 TaxID=2607730 RepID=UPI0011F12C82|nr:hypothetical protein [Aquimarina sp. RZ0]KAA1244711.1 hypothetical protein F0000_15160 [Aquimarina sp. RZ0]